MAFVIRLMRALFVLVLALAVLARVPALAQEDKKEVAPVNSFELFWPMVAGKTMDDGFIYTLKLVKERVRGWLIFGGTQKADYQVFLTTKRVLEAEKLINESKENLALQTLDAATVHLRNSQQNLEKARQSKPDAKLDTESRFRLQNLDKLIAWLTVNKNEDLRSRAESLRELISSLQSQGN